MRYDSQTIYEQQRKAYNFLAERVRTHTIIQDGKAQRVATKNDWAVDPKTITAPVQLVQETPFVNTSQIFTFDFSQNAPPKSPTLNNNTLPKRNIAAIYGIQFLIGTGANANNRTYNANAPTLNDESIYNSILQLKIETDTVIDILDGQQFRDEYQTVGMFDHTAGMVLINPIRVLSGEMGIFQINWTLKNSISTLPLTADQFLSMRLHCVMGQAQA